MHINVCVYTLLCAVKIFTLVRLTDERGEGLGGVFDNNVCTCTYVYFVLYCKDFYSRTVV